MKAAGGAESKTRRLLPDGLTTLSKNTGDDVDLKAENLYLREELERTRLVMHNAHPSSRLVDALRESPDRMGVFIDALREAENEGDGIDQAVSTYVQAMAAKSEMLNIIRMMQATLAQFEQRLLALDGQESRVDADGRPGDSEEFAGNGVPNEIATDFPKNPYEDDGYLINTRPDRFPVGAGSLLSIKP